MKTTIFALFFLGGDGHRKKALANGFIGTASKPPEARPCSLKKRRGMAQRLVLTGDEIAHAARCS